MQQKTVRKGKNPKGRDIPEKFLMRLEAITAGCVDKVKNCIQTCFLKSMGGLFQPLLQYNEYSMKYLSFAIAPTDFWETPWEN